MSARRFCGFLEKKAFFRADALEALVGFGVFLVTTAVAFAAGYFYARVPS